MYTNVYKSTKIRTQTHHSQMLKTENKLKNLEHRKRKTLHVQGNPNIIKN